MSKIRVLIADDNKSILEQIYNYLQKDDSIEVVGTAKDGLEAYNNIIDSKPDIAIIDSRMPMLTGTQVIEKLNNEHIHIKVILISGEVDLELRKIANELRIKNILSKPFKLEDLKVMILKAHNEEFEEQEQFVSTCSQETNKKQSFWDKVKEVFK